MTSRAAYWLYSPLTAFVFIDVTDIDASRSLFEAGLGFVVAENRFHPPHHIHGIVKYDAGGTILALNKARPGFRRGDSDLAVVTVISNRAVSDLSAGYEHWIRRSCADHEIRDADNHRFTVLQQDRANATVSGVHYLVKDLSATTDYFKRMFGWRFQRLGSGLVRIRTGDFVLSFGETKDEIEAHRAGNFLTVLYSPDLLWAHEQLGARGCRFLSAPQRSQIGRTVRFVDPDGHHFCLYEPSEECLGWESGPVLLRLIERTGFGH